MEGEGLRGCLRMGRPNEAQIWGQPVGFGESKGKITPCLTAEALFHPKFGAVLPCCFLSHYNAIFLLGLALNLSFFPARCGPAAPCLASF